MEFDKSKVYTAVNADELKVGSKVICADVLADLKFRVESTNFCEPVCLKYVNNETCAYRFVTDKRYLLAYLVSEPEEKKLKWTDLKVGDVIRHKNTGVEHLIVGLDKRNCTLIHIRIPDTWLSDDELKRWEKVNDK